MEQAKITITDKFANEIAKLRNNALCLSEHFLLYYYHGLNFFVGIMLILGIRLKANAIISAGLLIVFIVAVASAMIRGLDINCGCSSVHPEHVGFPKIFENTGLTILSVLIVWFPNKNIYS